MSRNSRMPTPGEFWSKVAGLGRSAGSEVAEAALALWFVLRSSSTPPWAKALIAGALAYFVSPIDAIPDFLPFGFTDDLAAMALVLVKVSAHRTEEVDEKVQAHMPSWAKKEEPDEETPEAAEEEAAQQVDDEVQTEVPTDPADKSADSWMGAKGEEETQPSA